MFRQIYLEEYGEELSDEETERRAGMLLNFYVAVYGNPAEVVPREG